MTLQITGNFSNRHNQTHPPGCNYSAQDLIHLVQSSEDDLRKWIHYSTQYGASGEEVL